MAENFDLIFGQNASQQYAWSDDDYQNGWQTVGNIPPTAAQFDALQRRNDTKMKELNDNLTPLVNANTAETRQPATAYNEGDMKFSPLLPTGWLLSCVVAGTTSAGEIVLPADVVENASVVDGTVTWKIRKISSADGASVGDIKMFAGNGALPAGWLECDGAAVSRTMYPDLFALIGTTYGVGDGSTTFNLPNLVGKFAEGAETAGVEKEAGLPNITGIAPHNLLAGKKHTGDNGALTTADITTDITLSNGTYDGWTRISFDASRSNHIYGNSTTVQPESLTVRYIIKAFDGQTADSALIDITQYAARLEQKADINGSNMVYHKDVITTSGAYTAPVTALYKITVKGGGGGGQGGAYRSSNKYFYAGAGGDEGGTTFVYEKLIAGDTVPVTIGAGGAGGTSVAQSTEGNAGTNGGTSTVTIGSSTYSAGGGHGGTDSGYAVTGTGTLIGTQGTAYTEGYVSSAGTVFGGNGGGHGGGRGRAGNINGTQGGGGGGGAVSGDWSSASVAGQNGGAGGDGYVWFEYYTPGA